MGCGNTKVAPAAEQGETPEEKVKRLQKEVDVAKKSVSSLEQEKTSVESSLTAEKAKLAELEKQAAAGKTADGSKTFQVVLTTEQVEALKKLSGISMLRVAGEAAPLADGAENICVVSVAADADILDVLKACGAPFKPERTCPPKKKELPKEEEKKEGEEKKEEEEETTKAAEEKEPPPPKTKIPDPDIKCENTIALDPTWDGKVQVQFNWIDSPNPYSEFNDPSGSNWWCHQPTLKGPGKPEKVTLEWRQGMGGEWKELDCTPTDNGKGALDFIADMDIHPEVEQGKERASSKYRGFQSRWVVDGDRYLSPLEAAPTLYSKLMKAPPIRNAMKSLPPEKQGSFDHLPNETMRNAIKSIENIMPMNTWDVAYDVSSVPGCFAKGEHIKNITESVAHVALEKSKDPAIVSEVRKTVLKSPITVAVQIAKTAGIPLGLIAKNIDDFFLPKFLDPQWSQLEALEAERLHWDGFRREMQDDVNCLYPTFQGGLRVTYPEVRSLADAIKIKRPKATTTHLPVKVAWKMTGPEMKEEHQLTFVYWGADSGFDKKVTVPLLAEKVTKSEGTLTKTEYDAWEEYTASVLLASGTYRYYYELDGKAYFNNGRPFGDELTPGDECYKELVIKYEVEFGIGVEF
eukprot:TRINITY_DN885_c0_g2_i1.p2 TRINITY_DN885_c0_g2~~TRINITY_DN885_c0_g2_i1.p2  ORF type:complete len:633 (+),score=284.70 TRINITY_DN885_c0_g2_i1:2571-4469(+)